MTHAYGTLIHVGRDSFIWACLHSPTGQGTESFTRNMFRMNKSCPIWMSHVPYEWVTSHMNECPICMSHEWVMFHVKDAQPEMVNQTSFSRAAKLDWTKLNLSAFFSQPEWREIFIRWFSFRYTFWSFKWDMIHLFIWDTHSHGTGRSKSDGRPQGWRSMGLGSIRWIQLAADDSTLKFLLPLVCALLCFIKPILGNRYGPMFPLLSLSFLSHPLWRRNPDSVTHYRSQKTRFSHLLLRTPASFLDHHRRRRSDLKPTHEFVNGWFVNETCHSYAQPRHEKSQAQEIGRFKFSCRTDTLSAALHLSRGLAWFALTHFFWEIWYKILTIIFSIFPLLKILSDFFFKFPPLFFWKIIIGVSPRRCKTKKTAGQKKKITIFFFKKIGWRAAAKAPCRRAPITTAKNSNTFHQESPYISNMFSRESPKFHKDFHLSKWSPRHSKENLGKLDNLEIQIF